MNTMFTITDDGRTEQTAFRLNVAEQTFMMFDVDNKTWVDVTEQYFGSDNPADYAANIQETKLTFVAFGWMLPNDTIEVIK